MHLPLRAVCGYVVANSPLGAWSFKRGLPLSLEVKEPGGSLCALCETFFTQESFRGCGLRKPAKGLEECSEKEQRSFSCPHHLKLDFAESSSAGLCRDYPAKNKKIEKWIGDNYYVIGFDDICGDPIIIENDSKDFPVYWMWHDNWTTLEKISSSSKKESVV